jgi:CheY-like chemotaxis protein
MEETKPKFNSVFLIDDDKLYLFSIKKMISFLKLCPNVSEFYNGQDAMERLKQITQSGNDQLPDVILLDINMPIMNGWEFLEAYKQIRNMFAKRIPIYMVSSSIDITDIDKSKNYSDIAAYLIKPIRPDKLKEIFL